MIITYIWLDWNIRQTEDVIDVPANIIKIDNNYFEKEIKIEKVKKEKVSETTETVVDLKVEWEVTIITPTITEPIKQVISEDVEARAKEFLKAQKVRWFGLLKGQKIIDKAVELGFII